MKHKLIETFVLPSRKREYVADLAPMLWHSFGCIASLIQEVTSIYPAINPPTLSVSLISIIYTIIY